MRALVTEVLTSTDQPTAVHLTLQETALRPFANEGAPEAGAGPTLGLATTDQLLPSQDSTRVLERPPLLKKLPTAVHALAVGQETPLSVL